MPERPVHWSEGLYLRPHHFQASERHLAERIRTSEEWLHPYAWGVSRVQMDPDALRNGIVAVTSLHARLADGTILRVPEEVSLDKLQLPARTSTSPMIHLAVRKLTPGRSSVAPGERYAVDSVEIADQTTGADRELVEFLRLQPILLADAETSQGYETLPIARLKRSAVEGEALLSLDPDYVPALLCLAGWTPLRDRADSFREYLRSVIRNEAQYLEGRKIAFDAQILGQSERILKLMACQSAAVPIEAALGAAELHPLVLYSELCRLVGSLGLFEPSRLAPSIPAYDHNNLGLIFATIDYELRRMLGQAPKLAADKRYFEMDKHNIFQVRLEPDWLLDTASLFIGIESADMNQAECDELMSGGHCDWKLASAPQVGEVFKNAEVGLKLKPLTRTPPELPSGVAYFEFDRRQPYWQDVLRTATFGLRFKKLSTQDRFLDAREVEFASPRTGRMARLKYAVFAIRPPGR